MPIHDDVPRPYDKIFVRYKLNDGKVVWWPADVLTSREASVPGTVRGTGEIGFDALHGDKATVQDVQFLADRTVQTEDGETAWRTSAEAADNGDGDQAEAAWEPVSYGTGATERARARPPEEQPTDDRPTKRTRRDAQDITDQDSREATTATTTPRSGARSRERTAAPHTTRGRRAARHVDPIIDRLSREVDMLKARVEQSGRREADAVVEEVVDNRRAVWRVKLLRELKKSFKPMKAARARPFNAVLMTGSVQVKELMGFKSFQRLARDVAITSTAGTNASPRGVRFYPSYSGIMEPHSEIKEARVFFDTASALFRWLGVTSSREVSQHVRKKDTLRTGLPIMRLLGGLQWTDGDTSKPLRIFVGSSCVGAVKDGDVVGGTTTRVVQFPTGQWDGSNNAFASVPVEQRCSPGEFKEGDGNKGTAFYISWTWAKELSGRAFAAHARRTETERLGNATVHYRAWCFEVRKLARPYVLL